MENETAAVDNDAQEAFDECVEEQRSKGESRGSARRICRDAMEERRGSARRAGTRDNKFYVKAFLIDPSININQWAVTEESIPKNINTFIGKPLVLTEKFDHPGADMETLNHWLQYQEAFRVGTIIDVIPKKNATTGTTAYHAVIEVTDKDLQESLRNNSVPIYVSPAIAQPASSIGAKTAEDVISEWTGIHLAIVDEPAYGVKKAVISETCGGDKQGCLLQLMKANVADFCHKQALKRYRIHIASIVGTSQARKSSPNPRKSMSTLETMDSTTVEKVEEPNTINNKQPVSIPPPGNTPTNIRDLLAENQKLLHELELRDLKIAELTDAHSTIQERIAALELRDRRKDIERIITPDLIKDDKTRLEKIKTLTSSQIPIKEIEEVYKDLKITIKKASVNQRAYAKVPYGVTSNLSSQTTASVLTSTTTEDDGTGMTSLQKQLAVLKGGLG